MLKYLSVTTLSLLAFNMAHAASYEVIEHRACNEIRLKQESQNLRWGSVSGGGSHNVNEINFRALTTGMLDQVHFGPHGTGAITFKLNGKPFVPNAIASTQNFGIEVQALYDDSSSSIVGKFIGFTDANLDTRWFEDPAAQFGKFNRLLAAVMYINKALETVPLVVPCDYVPGDLNPADSRCLWIDQYSHPSNNKPYCW